MPVIGDDTLLVLFLFKYLAVVHHNTACVVRTLSTTLTCPHSHVYAHTHMSHEYSHHPTPTPTNPPHTADDPNCHLTSFTKRWRSVQHVNGVAVYVECGAEHDQQDIEGETKMMSVPVACTPEACFRVGAWVDVGCLLIVWVIWEEGVVVLVGVLVCLDF